MRIAIDTFDDNRTVADVLRTLAGSTVTVNFRDGDVHSGVLTPLGDSDFTLHESDVDGVPFGALHVESVQVGSDA